MKNLNLNNFNKKHFEQLWEESENQSHEIIGQSSFDEILKLIKLKIYDIEIKDNVEDDIGVLLFYISHISKSKNINVYAALSEAIDDSKIKKLEKFNNY